MADATQVDKRLMDGGTKLDRSITRTPTENLPRRIDVYPGKPVDVAEVIAGMTARNREKRGETVAHPIESINDIFSLLERISKKRAGTAISPFLDELHIIGHGTPGKFGIGTYMYDSDSLKKIAKGKVANHFKDSATVYLEGCDAAAGAEGLAFTEQIGRVFFGDKTGYVWGNTCPVIIIGEMTTCKPVSRKYPHDFKK